MTWNEFKVKTANVPKVDFIKIEYSKSWYISTVIQDEKIEYYISKYDTTELTDFLTNYEPAILNRQLQTSSLAYYDGKDLYRKSFKETVTGGQSSPPNKVSFSFTEEILLFGGHYIITGDVAEGTYLEVGLTDEDNILGYGAGFVLGKFMETEYVIAGEYTNIHPLIGKCDSSTAAKLIPSYFYLTVWVYTTGTSPANDLDLIMRFYPWR